jgi:Uri superfamily endonuclease
MQSTETISPEQVDRPPAAAGAYVLMARVSRLQTCRIGRLGEFAIPAGFYAYVGSAHGPGGLAARVGRHLRVDKRLHWHIDYLLPAIVIEEVWGAVSARRLECEWAGQLLRSRQARSAIPRFGASDCGCPTHLIYWATCPARQELWSTLGVQWLLSAGRSDRLHAP